MTFRPIFGKRALPGAIYDAATREAQRTYLFFFVLTTLALTSMVAYLVVRVRTLGGLSFSPAEILLGVLLFIAELFLMIHSAGYFASVMKATRRDAIAQPEIFEKAASAPVAVIVAIFNEQEHVVEETLAAVRAMDYPVLNLYLLDDSTNEECRAASRRIAERYRAHLRQRVDRSGYKAGAINDVLPELTEPYIAMLDADQRPNEGWLKDIVPLLERDPELAMVQVPQVYANIERLRVARTARYQQGIFFEHICEGKAYSNAMFCCGTNVVFRRSALESIETMHNGRRNFLDESSITEDFATTLRLHLAGWKTEYVNQPYVFGMGPETLAAYYTQHMRWAQGTFGVGLRALRIFLKNPRALTFGQWWEYFLSTSYYFVGCANLVFIATPAMFLFFGVRPFRAPADAFLLAFVPYVLFSMSFVFLGLTRRKYDPGTLWLATALTFTTSWVYVKAFAVAILGLKRGFAVTPKGFGGAIPLTHMPVEVMLFLINLVATAVGLYYIAFVAPDVAYVVSTVWAAYQAVLMSLLFFYFNRPVEIDDGPLVFERVSLAVR
jgi:cellulose synthase (UDP-forming)